jgi:hypothetical protein
MSEVKVSYLNRSKSQFNRLKHHMAGILNLFIKLNKIMIFAIRHSERTIVHCFIKNKGHCFNLPRTKALLEINYIFIKHR